MSSESALSGTVINGRFLHSAGGTNIREETGALLKSILQRLVAHPNDVQVSYFQGERTTVYNINVHVADYGYLLGKKGTTINSLRTVIRAMMARQQIRVVLEAPNAPRPQGFQNDME